MTAVAYALGRPRSAANRGGDCRARDLGQTVGETIGDAAPAYDTALLYDADLHYTGVTISVNHRHVHGPHRFAVTSHCQISNGLMRLTVGDAGVAPSLTVEAWRGRVVVGDYLSDTLSDTLPGSTATPSWLSVFTLTIDSPSVAAVLTAVQLVRISPESVTVRLVAPLMADAFVTLRRGERMARIQHGNTRGTLVDIDRRVRITAAPSPAGSATGGLIEEMVPTFEGFPRFVGAIDPVTANAATFALTAASVTTARFGAGVGTWAQWDRPRQMLSQLGDASRARLVAA